MWESWEEALLYFPVTANASLKFKTLVSFSNFYTTLAFSFSFSFPVSVIQSLTISQKSQASSTLTNIYVCISSYFLTFFFCFCLVGASIFAFEFSNFYLKRTECILWFFSFLFIWLVLQFCWVWCLLCFWVFFDVSFSLTFLMLFGCWENIGSWSPWFRTNHFVGKEFS